MWKENQPPGKITTLEAADNDAPENGKPFRFELAPEASSDVRSKFSVEGERQNRRARLIVFLM